MTDSALSSLLSRPSFCYLAAPYTHPDLGVRNARVQQIGDAVAWLMGQGVLVFSTLSMTHEIGIRHMLPTEFEYWVRLNHCMIERSGSLLVLQLAGWQQSRGIADELAYARELSKPVFWLDPSTMGLSAEAA